MTPQQVLRGCRIGTQPLFYIGTFNSGVTVLSQQVRALNLAWALVESNSVNCVVPNRRSSKPKRIAVVGGGFAGLTFAAGLIAKQANAEITIFEERDTLLPLQHGSDSRWLHPQIYNWPGERSEMNVAMLPVMNWTAARASDVVVQMMGAWKSGAEQSAGRLKLFCNTRHLQIHTSGSGSFVIEWVGEERDPKDATISGDGRTVGASDTFDLVVLAVGFGLEIDNAVSYWRNEQLGQPSLNHPRRTYIVSGQGDGAMIDLLRLRVSHYRPDRILDELFSNRAGLLDAIETLYDRSTNRRSGASLFAAFEALIKQSNTVGTEFKSACDDLRKRLRRDTDVILQMRQSNFAGLFGPGTSFQNRLLVYLLFKCGGFVPTADKTEIIMKKNGLADDCMVIRHGTERERQFDRIFSGNLLRQFNRKHQSGTFSLSTDVLWLGGYFGYSGTEAEAARLPDILKKAWRKEYLPAPTNLLATALCAAISGYLGGIHPPDKRLRVTMHRAIQIGSEEVLQQACDYQGIAIPPVSNVGRTFPAQNATIGLAYQTRKVIRSRRRVSRLQLERAMERLRLGAASSKMAKAVGFVLAIPLLEPEDEYTLPKPLIGVIFIDSEAPGFYLDDGSLQIIIAMTQRFLDSLSGPATLPDERGNVRNFRLSAISRKRTRPGSFPKSARKTLEIVQVAPPVTSRPFQLNFDYSDFVPTQSSKAFIGPIATIGE